MLSKPSYHLQKITYNKNIPLTVIWELTRRCNLNCIHCYIPFEDRCQPRSKHPELSLDEIKKILNQLRSLGCMYIVFTGGEPFLRSDILKILESARKMGFEVRVFTNGTLLLSKKDIIPYLKKLGISAVEISLYGPQKVHDGITQIKGSYSKTISAIESCLSAGIKVVLKTPLMKGLNFSKRWWLWNFANKKNLILRFDPMLTLEEGGNRSNLKLRLDRKSLRRIHKEFGGYFFCDFYENFDQLKNKKTIPKNAKNNMREYLFYCGAGRNFAAISFDGTLYPCLELKNMPLGNLKEKSFLKLWYPTNRPTNSSPLKYIRETLLSEKSECFNCRHLAYCPRCPAISYREKEKPGDKNYVSCLLAEARSEIINVK